MSENPPTNEDNIRDQDTSSSQGVETKTKEPTLLESLHQRFKDTLSSQEIIELEKIISSSENPDEDPIVLRKVALYLEEQGSEVTDIHEKSLKLESQADIEAKKINELTTEQKMPTMKYDSNVGIYGLNVEGTPEGIVYKGSKRLLNWIEGRLRAPADKGGKVTDFFVSALRKRGSLKQIAENIKALGLENYFTIEEGKIIERSDDIGSGFFLDDLLRLQDEHNFIKQFDKQDAIKRAIKMIANVHEKSGKGVGEVLPNDIIFGVKENLSGPDEITHNRLSLPDIIYANNVEPLEQQATDILDFLFALGSSGFQTEGDIGAQRNIETALSEYKREDVLLLVKGLLKTGRPFPAFHNMIRLGYDRVENKKEAFKKVRKIIEDLLF